MQKLLDKEELSIPSNDILIIMQDNNKVTKRKATRSDFELARKVHHEGYHDIVIQRFGKWEESKQDEFFAKDWETGGFDIVFYNNTPCGYIAVEDHKSEIYIREIVISPKFQGLGIGTTLINEVINQAKERKVPVKLGTFHKNKAAILYERLGFKKVGETDTHILFEWNEW